MLLDYFMTRSLIQVWAKRRFRRHSELGRHVFRPAVFGRRPLVGEPLETRNLLAAVVDFANPIVEIAGGVSHLTRDEDSVSMRTDATSLTPGDAVTAWWAVFNHPEFCSGACGVDDLNTPEVQAALFYADGQVVGANGTATFMSTLAEGDISRVDTAHGGFPGAGIGLVDSRSADVHIVLRTHGPASQDAAVLNSQLTTFNGGCTPACSNLQAAIHEPPGRSDHMPGDVTGDGKVDVLDIHALCAAIRQGDAAQPRLDLNGDTTLNLADVHTLVFDRLGTSFGDANLDGVFDSRDLVELFQAGQYEDEQPENSVWETGDWNCDGEFDSSDLVLAFQIGRYVAAANQQPPA